MRLAVPVMKMRKVFLSTIGLAEVKDLGFVSDDFDLNNTEYKFAWPQLMDQYVNSGDEVIVAPIVQVEQTSKENKNYDLYKEEVTRALNDKQAKVTFCSIPEETDFTTRSFHKAFKAVADIINDEDLIYLDLGNGPMPFVFSSFVACNYAIKASKAAEMGRVIYTENDMRNKQAKIYDMTGVFFLNQMAGTVAPGDKEEVDSMLDMMLED